MGTPDGSSCITRPATEARLTESTGRGFWRKMQRQASGAMLALRRASASTPLRRKSTMADLQALLDLEGTPGRRSGGSQESTSLNKLDSGRFWKHAAVLLAKVLFSLVLGGVVAGMVLAYDILEHLVAGNWGLVDEILTYQVFPKMGWADPDKNPCNAGHNRGV